MSVDKHSRVFVIEGTPAWEAWRAVIAGWPPLVTREVGGETRQGAFFPSLFPPSAKSGEKSE